MRFSRARPTCSKRRNSPSRTTREVLNALSELTPVFENERSYFVLGNYDREPIRRLNLVVDRLNRRPDAYAFRMVDVKGEWNNSIQTFCLIADLVTAVVGVAEKDPSGFLVEQACSPAPRSTSRKVTSPSESTPAKRALQLDGDGRVRLACRRRPAVPLVDSGRSVEAVGELP